LQVIEEGRLTDGRGNVARFSEAVIILTSNIGSEYLSVPVVDDNVREQVMEEVRSTFRPEFINRLDEVILFNSLSSEDLANIMRLLLKNEQKLARERGLELTFTDGAINWLLAQNDQPEYGARPLKRIIRRFVREPLADFLLTANPPAGTEVRVSTSRRKDAGLKFAATVDGKEVAVEA
jgi:ATP-dependent Clp protease ATP-binding subunit ClpB